MARQVHRFVLEHLAASRAVSAFAADRVGCLEARVVVDRVPFELAPLRFLAFVAGGFAAAELALCQLAPKQYH